MNQSTKKLIFLVFLACISAALYGCAQDGKKYVRDGVEYGVTGSDFTGQWWEYYERGRSFADGRFYKKALADLQQAVKNQAEDQRQVRTSDNHFIDYFPHRELGILYFQRHEYDKAIEELEQSIESVPSARAHFFLNKARATWILRNGTDFRPPVLNIKGKKSPKITNKFSLTVKGVASDDNFIAGINVGTQQIPMELAVQKKTFSAEVPLAEGENIIRVTATDLTGKTTEQTIHIYSDRQGPQIEIEKLTVADNQVTVKGNVSDNKGISLLKINSRRWPITGRAPGYNFEVRLPEGKITVVARDRAGNTTRAVVRKNELIPEQSPSQSQTEQSAEDSEEPPSTSEAAVNLPQDKKKPSIWLEDLGPGQETYEDKILLKGQISDNSLLSDITINGTTLSTRRGRSVYFSLLKKLQRGENKFHIAAIDEHGNRAEKTFTVLRKIPNIRMPDSRMTVAVLPFDRRGEISPRDDTVQNQLIDSFKKSARFNIVEPRKIDSILRELKLMPSQLVNSGQAADIGRIAEAQAVLSGSVIQNRDSVEVTGRLIDAETGTILAVNDIFGENGESGSLPELLDSLALKFKQDFPLAEGTVLEIKENVLVIDLGRDTQIRPGTQVVCYRQCPPTRHPVTGQLLTSEPQIIDILKVQDVFDDYSRATVVNGDTGCIVSDKVITR